MSSAPSPQPIRNLVFSGGGVRGVAYVGAIDALEKASVLSGVRRVAGASAGAITAGLLAAGADAERFAQLFSELSFPAFLVDRWGIFGDVVRLFRRYGLHTGDPLVKWLRDVVARLTRESLGREQADITLAELAREALSGAPVRRFFGVGTNLTLQIPEVFSAASTPELPLWQAMRASASFPLVFAPFTIDGAIYVDGGLTWNYPIDLFDGDYRRRTKGRPIELDRGERTLGFVLGRALDDVEDVPVTSPVRIDDLSTFGHALTSFVLDESTRLHVSKDAAQRTVMIDDLGLSAVDFDVTSAQEAQLVENGRAATYAFLERQTGAR